MCIRDRVDIPNSRGHPSLKKRTEDIESRIRALLYGEVYVSQLEKDTKIQTHPKDTVTHLMLTMHGDSEDVELYDIYRGKKTSNGPRNFALYLHDQLREKNEQSIATLESIFFDSCEVSYCTSQRDSFADLFADTCLLYTSPSPRDRTRSRMPSSA